MGNKTNEEAGRNFFYDNLEYIRLNLGVSVNMFCSHGNQEGLIPLSDTMFNKYKLSGSSPKDTKLKDIADAVSDIIRGDDGLRAKFPNGVLPTELTDIDLRTLAFSSSFSGIGFHSKKFEGAYICYYGSTNVEGKTTMRYGVINLIQGEKPEEFYAAGVFSIKNYEDALSIHRVLAEKKDNTKEDVKKAFSSHELFEGQAHLSTSMIWCNLTTKNRSEFVTMSFDLDFNVVTKNPQKVFIGTRGIALSQTSGQGFQTVTFPIIIVKEPLSLSPNAIEKYLHFNYNQINSDIFSEIADKTIGLLQSFGNGDNFSDELKKSLLSQLLKSEITRLLSLRVFNSHYYVHKEMVTFYDDIIKPGNKKSEIPMLD